MSGNMARNKGQRGEREAAALLMGWSKEVVQTMREYGVEVPDVELVRNLNQARVGSGGSYDLIGLDWLALEVKRQETLNVSAWWAQTVRQKQPGQIAFLMYRQNNRKWQFMVEIKSAHYGKPGSSAVCELVVTMDEQQAKVWYNTQLWLELQKQNVDAANGG